MQCSTVLYSSLPSSSASQGSGEAVRRHTTAKACWCNERGHLLPSCIISRASFRSMCAAFGLDKCVTAQLQVQGSRNRSAKRKCESRSPRFSSFASSSGLFGDASFRDLRRRIAGLDPREPSRSLQNCSPRNRAGPISRSAAPKPLINGQISTDDK